MRRNHQETHTKDEDQEGKCPNGCVNGWLIIRKPEENNREVAVHCDCMEQRSMKSRYESAEIPDEFKDARFETYEITDPVHETMRNAMLEYIRAFPNKKDREPGPVQGPSLGFIAEFGEQRMKALEPKDRGPYKKKYNSYGIGKTHLQMAAAKALIKKGYRVLCISDPVYMQEITSAKQTGDQERINRLIGTAVNWADFLVWDDLGKSKYSESKEDTYYQILNQCYKKKKPIIYSSNEDIETIENKIGQAATSRLLGMSKNHFYKLKGPDMRKRG
jgi:DNA replication protein DnaC